jgi:hypothetical protein
VEPRGCNRWQLAANRSDAETAKQAKSIASGCHQLPEKFHGKQGVCRGLPPAAGGPLPEKEGVDAHVARLCAPISPGNPGTGTGRCRSRYMPCGSWRDDTHGFQPRSVCGSSRSAAPPGAEGRGRRGSLTPMSGGGSSRWKSPQSLVRRRRRRKLSVRTNHGARSRLQVRLGRSFIVRRRALLVEPNDG